jgi:glycosyltransferase involved in cell wall biosynthesis
LAQADVLLFARGQISTRRGSALAGIACGLPVVAYSGPDTTAPVTEAGVVLVKEGDSEGLAAALERVLSDARLRAALRKRSRRAQQRYFSWSAIAALYAEDFPYQLFASTAMIRARASASRVSITSAGECE